MSSAAKLRHIGRGTAVVASAALVMTSFGPAAFAAWDTPPQGGTITQQPDPAVGIVDTDKAAVGTQGATLVQPGQAAQALNDVRLVLPNSFRKGDVIDLRVFDRSATMTSNGRGNAGPSTKMEFSADATTEVSRPQAADTEVAVTSVGGATNGSKEGTESTLDNPWVAPTGVTGAAATAPGLTPAFDVSRVASTGSAYRDTIRLTVNTDPSTGDPNAKWVVTVKDLALDLGPQVTPGELRIVPFAYNTETANLVAAPALFGNIENQARLSGGSLNPARVISIYTVPGYVAPVTFEAGSPNITANAGVQSIGDLSIKETNGASLTSGTYTVNISGATIANTAINQLTAALTDGGTNERVTITGFQGAAGQATGFTFRVDNADISRVSTIKVSGLMLNAGNPGRLEFRLSGGSVNEYLADGGQSNAITNGGTLVYESSDAFAGASVTDDEADAPLAAAAFTAQPAALNSGTYTVGSNSLGQVTLVRNNQVVATSLDGGTNFTLTAPYSGNITFDRAVLAGETVTVDPVDNTEGAAATPALTTATAVTSASFGTQTGALTIRRDLTTNTLRAFNSSGQAVAEANTATPTVFAQLNTSGVAFTYPAGTTARNGDTITISDASNGTVTGTAAGTAAADGADLSTGAILPPATYTVYTDGTTTQLRTAGGAVVGTAGANAQVINLTSPYAGTVTATQVLRDGMTITIAPPTATTAIPTTAATAASLAAYGANPLATGGYTVARTGTGPWQLTDDANSNAVVGTSTDGVNFTLQGTQNGEALSGIAVLNRQVPAGTAFTLAVNNAAGDVNQQDIIGPRDSLTQLGTVSAGISSIGGSNRFGTAARIAHEFVRSTGKPTADAAIVVNGMSAPDALSSSFLSQREGAPILLTAPGQLPAETVEALRDLGVRKVYIVGGRTAVGEPVFNALRNQDAYMWDEAAKAIKPRGDKLEVVQLGGDNRYQTNWRVNTYAAAQTADAASVGKIGTGYGKPMATTAMLARSSTATDFVDALSASVLSAGPAGGLTQSRTAGFERTLTVTNGTFALPSSVDPSILEAGTYRLDVVSSVNVLQRLTNTGWVTVPNTTWNSGSLTVNGTVLPVVGTAVSGNGFAITNNDQAGARYGYDNRVKNANALPVILTQPGQLVAEAQSQMRALHIEHMLLIGGDTALAPAVNDQVAGVGATSYRIGGADRWETAANVNRFAMNKQAATREGEIPGLGFDGNRVYADSEGRQRVGGGMTVYLANGLKFPDALVAGPWVSRTRNAMVMTLQNDLPAPTATFISEKAAQLDNAAGLGQGAAVSSAVVAEANQIAATK